MYLPEHNQTDSSADAAIAVDERLDLPPVVVADVSRIDLDSIAGFHVEEAGRIAKRKVNLGVVQHVKDDDLVPLVVEMMKGAIHGLGFVVEVADQNDQAVPA